MRREWFDFPPLAVFLAMAVLAGLGGVGWYATSSSAAPAMLSSFERGDDLRVSWGTAAISTSKGSCSGTLVGPESILTAAHCVTGRGDIRVQVNYRTNDNVPQTSGACLADRSLVPDEYEDRDFVHDYAILHVRCVWVDGAPEYRRLTRYEGGDLTSVTHRGDAKEFSNVYVSRGTEVSRSPIDHAKGCLALGPGGCVKILLGDDSQRALVTSTISIVPGSSGGLVTNSSGEAVAVVTGYKTSGTPYSILTVLNDDVLQDVRSWIRQVDPSSLNA